MQLAFFADENISDELIEWLKQQQYKISSIKAEKLFGVSDKTIIEKCFIEKLIIITHDNDFGKIIFTENVSFHIIIYLRPGHFDGRFHIPSMQKLLLHTNFILPGSLLICQRKSNKIQIRFRQIKNYDNT